MLVRMKGAIFFLVIGILLIGLVSTVSYAQQGPPRDLLDVSQAPFKVKVIEAGELRAEFRPLYTTFGNPPKYVTPSGGSYDGVGDLILTRADFTVRCSGALLTDGIHVLTAAHCVTNDEGDFNLQSGFATFEGDTGDFQISVIASATEVHPDWDGDVFRGNDIAVLELLSEAPPEITRYDIDRDGSDDVGAVGDKAGYGRSGNGDNGDVMPSGKKRDGQNKYDDVADTMLEALRLRSGTDFVAGSVLQYDFDNLDPENDAFGFFFGNPDLGLGQPEVNSAPGDSGGPTLTNGEITGITSYGVRLSFIFGATSDVDDELNSSFGEFSGDTRVSKYASFIDGVLPTPPPSDTTPPTIISSTTTSTTTIDLTASETVTSTADAADFTVNGIGANTVGTVAASGTTITLTLSAGSISDTDVITVDYTKATGSIIDSSSNIMATFAGQSVTNTLDTTAPAAPVITSPTNDATVTTATPTVTGTSEADASIKVFDGAVSVATTTASDVGSWSVATSFLSDGSHILTAKATDATGNTSAASAAVNILVDTTAPTVPTDDVDITKAKYNTRNGQLRVEATFTNPSEDLFIFDITINPDPTEAIGKMRNNGDGTYQFKGKDVLNSCPGFTIKVTTLPPSNIFFETTTVVCK